MIRSRRLAVVLLCTVAGACADGSPAGPDDGDTVSAARGGKGNGNGNGGGDGGGAPIVDDLTPWDASQWLPQTHTLGRSFLDGANVTQGPLGLLLTLPAGVYGGAEIRSADRLRYRSVEARLQAPDAPGSISAFFFYEGVRKRNDEIDIEIMNDGTGTVWFTTWVNGAQSNHREVVVPFDPSAGLHDYRIEWSSSRVGFYVDGVLYEEFTSGVPRDAMYLMSNAWWPVWLSGPVPTSPRSLSIDRITY